MTTSGSVNFTINRDEIVIAAARKIGIVSRGVTLRSEDIAEGAQILNLIVKQLQGKPDFAGGFKMWTRKRGFLFPELDEHEYTLGPNGDHATSSYVETTLSADEASSQTVLSVTSITSISDGDNIGIRLDDETIHWTTVNGAPAAGEVTVDDALPSAASSGAIVYAYTTKLLMPLEMISVRRKITTGAEDSLHLMSLGQYEAIGDKTLSATPTRYLYERGITDGAIKFDIGISDTTEVYQLTFLRPIEDFDAASDTPDFPQEYERYLVFQTAKDWAPERGKTFSKDAEDSRKESMAIAQNLDAEDAEPIFFEPDR